MQRIVGYVAVWMPSTTAELRPLPARGAQRASGRWVGTSKTDETGEMDECKQCGAGWRAFVSPPDVDADVVVLLSQPAWGDKAGSAPCAWERAAALRTRARAPS